MLPAQENRLSCPFCGFDVTDLLVHHPEGFVSGVAVAITKGLPCCGDEPTNAEVKDWARKVADSDGVDALLRERVL